MSSVVLLEILVAVLGFKAKSHNQGKGPGKDPKSLQEVPEAFLPRGPLTSIESCPAETLLLRVQTANALNRVPQLGCLRHSRRFSFDINLRAFISSLLAMIKIYVMWKPSNLGA